MVLKYTKEHEWIEIETYRMGISDYAQKELGEVVFIELPIIDRQVLKGEVVAVIESTKAASDIYAPVTGYVRDVNLNLKINPSMINIDPFGEGWICTIEPTKPEELSACLDEYSYNSSIEKGAEDYLQSPKDEIGRG
jgi:glycine cleavage system H protein